MTNRPPEFFQSYFHGTKACLKHGDLIVPGHGSNYRDGQSLRHVYLTSNLNVAIWGAELAFGEGVCRVYVVEATGPIEDDPNVTNKRFSGNPTNSFRTLHALRVTGEVKDWQGHSPDEIKARKESLEKLMKEGASIID